MGSILSIFKIKKNFKVVMIGLSGSGKTTILYKLKLGELIKTIPTVGFNIETIEYKNAKFNIWDMGGYEINLKLWKNYFNDADGIIYVIDSTNCNRFNQNYSEISKILAIVPTVPILLLANKQDIDTSTKISELTLRLKLYEINNRKWYIQSTSAVNNSGIIDGINWLYDNIK